MNCIQLDLDLPGFQIRPNTRVRILPPHKDAGKTGRIWDRSKPFYTVSLRGKLAFCKRTDLEIIDQRREFKRANYTYKRGQ
jgi:hypothetical protein